MDLDIDHYDLNDLLKLFKLKIDYNENDLKEVRKIVNATHPDKSGLPPEYFIFYSKAYKILWNIYDSNHKIIKPTGNTTYNQEESDTSKINAVKKLTSSKQFNKEFNDLFNQYYIKSDNDGYGEWFSQEQDEYSETTNNDKERYDKLKQQSRELAINYEVKPNYISGSNGLNHMDLKEAYTTGLVIGIDETDFKNVKTYKSVEELKQHRGNIKPLSREESIKILNENKLKDDTESVHRIYNLNKEYEENKKNNNKFWSKFLKLTF